MEVTAPWCPVCKAQAPILSRLKSEPRFKELVSFNIDFDSQKDLLQKFNVQKQSTLIVFKGSQEAGRSTGDTNADSIEALLGEVDLTAHGRRSASRCSPGCCRRCRRACCRWCRS